MGCTQSSTHRTYEEAKQLIKQALRDYQCDVRLYNIDVYQLLIHKIMTRKMTTDEIMDEVIRHEIGQSIHQRVYLTDN